jgi:hypothetical protein
MNQQQMKNLIEQHIASEIAGDTAGAVSVYTDDVEHDLVGTAQRRPRGSMTNSSPT